MRDESCRRISCPVASSRCASAICPGSGCGSFEGCVAGSGGVCGMSSAAIPFSNHAAGGYACPPPGISKKLAFVK